MTFGEFKKEDNWFSNYLLKLWGENKIPLFPAIELYEQKRAELLAKPRQLNLL